MKRPTWDFYDFYKDAVPLGMYNSDMEYAIGARYILTKYISASSHYNSDIGVGIGLTITY